jgi:hypothetical protein
MKARGYEVMKMESVSALAYLARRLKKPESRRITKLDTETHCTKSRNILEQCRVVDLGAVQATLIHNFMHGAKKKKSAFLGAQSETTLPKFITHANGQHNIRTRLHHGRRTSIHQMQCAIIIRPRKLVVT